MITTRLPPNFLSERFCAKMYPNAFHTHDLQTPSFSFYDYLSVINRIKSFLSQSDFFPEACQWFDPTSIEMWIATFVLKQLSLLSPTGDVSSIIERRLSSSLDCWIEEERAKQAFQNMLSRIVKKFPKKILSQTTTLGPIRLLSIVGRIFKKGPQEQEKDTLNKLIGRLGNHQAPFYKKNSVFIEPLTLISGALQCKEEALMSWMFLVHQDKGDLTNEIFTKLGDIVCDHVLGSMEKALFDFFKAQGSQMEKKQFDEVWKHLMNPYSVSTGQTFKTGKEELIGAWRCRMASLSGYDKAASSGLFPRFDKRQFLAWLQANQGLVLCLKKNQIDSVEVARQVLSALNHYDTVF